MLCAIVVSAAVGQAPAPTETGGAKIQAMPIRPREPSGMFGDSLGSYLTIEGVLDDRFAMGIGASNALRVDTVDGKKLARPIYIPIQNVDLPAGKRCVLKGYELGHMIGRPPAEYDAAKEQGQDAEELVKNDQTVWRWSPCFVVLIAAKPEGLKFRKP